MYVISEIYFTVIYAILHFLFHNFHDAYGPYFFLSFLSFSSPYKFNQLFHIIEVIIIPIYTFPMIYYPLFFIFRAQAAGKSASGDSQFSFHHVPPSLRRFYINGKA